MENIVQFNLIFLFAAPLFFSFHFVFIYFLFVVAFIFFFCWLPAPRYFVRSIIEIGVLQECDERVFNANAQRVLSRQNHLSYFHINWMYWVVSWCMHEHVICYIVMALCWLPYTIHLQRSLLRKYCRLKCLRYAKWNGQQYNIVFYGFSFALA